MAFTAGTPSGVEPTAAVTAAASGTESVGLDLPYQAESVSAARRLVRVQLALWGLDHLVEDAQVIVSELATNAAKTGCRLRMRVEIERLTEKAVQIRVTDGCRILPVMVKADGQDEGGRGIALIHHLTGGRWGADQLLNGKTVHAELGAVA
ncbi:anti-sigma regulatory factor (Ser/Thr protein kinase) [Kitasatospora sp. MAA4]|uniref:ATP-binding protein n=1 Tax=Kitasatospora sp. MAA4 TaxID=3035093 RepID=UPI0024750749|nr:ATP-binding protein [Kitasatospora sp. MAA4]MDH6130954.1 anti-sigma regulatory factor (Ser/Thr protein kinase) [Kitasatospora sp. MAA4]